jgi:glutamyl/glutaminyl-tRNA synthetase
VAFNARDLIENVGDVVLARRDMGSSYHLSVVVDDAVQGITHVTRAGTYSRRRGSMSCCNGCSICPRRSTIITG